MFDRYRYARKYKAFKRSHSNEAGEWNVSLQDTRVLLDSLPLSVVRKFDQAHINYLKRYVGGVYYENTDVLLDAVREGANAMRNQNYLETPTLEISSVELNRWVQPTPVACNFGFLLTEFRTQFGEFVDAYNQAPEGKAGYYRRKSFRVISDVFSLVELLSDLTIAGKELNA